MQELLLTTTYDPEEHKPGNNCRAFLLECRFSRIKMRLSVILLKYDE